MQSFVHLKQSMKIQIDIATSLDFQEVIRMLEKLYLELGEEKESMEFLSIPLLESVTKGDGTIILKAVSSNNDFLGILCLSEAQAIYAGGMYGIVNDMYVLPQYRSQSIGKKLLEKAKVIAAEKTWKRIEVTAPTDENEKTVKFYKDNGFVFIGPKLKWKI